MIHVSCCQILQNLVEGLQLQLTGSLPQGLQLAGLETGPGGSILSQTVQIDASLLQQLQQQGNINITINPQLLTQQVTTTDQNLVQVSLLKLGLGVGMHSVFHIPICTQHFTYPCVCSISHTHLYAVFHIPMCMQYFIYLFVCSISYTYLFTPFHKPIYIQYFSCTQAPTNKRYFQMTDDALTHYLL